VLLHIFADLLLPLLALLGLLAAAWLLLLLRLLRHLRLAEPEAYERLNQPDLFSYTPAAALRLLRFLRGDEARALQDTRARTGAQLLHATARLLAGGLALLVLLELIVGLGRP
jgi:hypothetical protein